MDSAKCADGPGGGADMIFFASGPGGGSALSDVIIIMICGV